MEKNETFRRAHGAKQKQERIRQIVDAAAEIYDKDGYDAVTFSSVGRKVNFNRANIYHYFPNIEDIFLLILRRDIETMVCDAEQSFKDFRGGADSFAAAWAALMLRHQRMLSLFCVANTLLLRNATPKAHLEFREDIFTKYNRLNVIIKNIFPSMSDESIIKFIDYENSYAMTLYPASIEYKKAQGIQIFPDAGYGTRPFAVQYEPYLKTLLKALLVKDTPVG